MDAGLSHPGEEDARSRLAIRLDDLPRLSHPLLVVVYAVVDDSLSSSSPLGDSLDVVVRREDVERLVEEVRRDETEVAKNLRVEARELESGGQN